MMVPVVVQREEHPDQPIAAEAACQTASSNQAPSGKTVREL
jgi:hypothetical protein